MTLAHLYHLAWCDLVSLQALPIFEFLMFVEEDPQKNQNLAFQVVVTGGVLQLVLFFVSLVLPPRMRMIAVILVPTEPVAFSVAFVLLPLEFDRKDIGLKISGDKIFLS